MTPSISIIVPVFNGEVWLADCLDSLCNQAFSDFEIICVNDASSDASLKILSEYARRDPRLTVVDLSKNCGEGTARNTGMAVARGKYTGFVDCDDTIDTSFYAALYAEAENSGADMVSAPIRIVTDGNRPHEVLHFEWFCSSLFRTDFLRKNAIRFPGKFSIGDDTVFMVRALIYRPLRRKISTPCYNYRQISASASHRPTGKKCRSCLKAYDQAFSEIALAVNAGDLPPGYAQVLFADFLQHLLRFIIHKSTDPVKHEAAKMLVELYANYPHRGEADTALRRSDPALLDLLEGGDATRLAAYFQGGKRRFAADLRARLKKAPR